MEKSKETDLLPAEVTRRRQAGDGISEVRQAREEDNFAEESTSSEAQVPGKLNRNSRRQKVESPFASPTFPQSSAPWQELFRRVAKEFRQD